MLSITLEVYFRDLNWIQEKQKNEPPPRKKNGKLHSSLTLSKRGKGGVGTIFVNKENITVNQGIQNSREEY